MNMLVFCDDYWHPGGVVQDGLTFLAKDGHHLDFLLDAREFHPAQLADYPLVIFAKSDNISAADQTSWMTPEVGQAFSDYVERGGGLLAIHSGTVYAETPAFRALLGGVFVEHPPQCPVTVTPLVEHTLTAGIEPFTVIDEHYHMALDDPQAVVFLETRSEHGVQPGGWMREHGKGCVCVLTPGHNLPVWQHPSFQTTLRNSIQWLIQPRFKTRETAKGRE